MAASSYDAALALAITLAFAGGALAGGDHSPSPHHQWVHGLHSPAGTWCCNIEDGELDPDWRMDATGYRVMIDGKWMPVPASAVITEPNKTGRAIVWVTRIPGAPVIRCFLPGGGA